MGCGEIENLMVAEGKWRLCEPPEVEEKLSGAGWMNAQTGVFVSEEDAFDYALEQCLEVAPAGIRKIKWTDEFRDMLVKWFYSGNYWIKED